MSRRNRLHLEELEGRIVPTLLGQQLFPADNPWNQNIASAPVAANSAAVIAHIGSAVRVHPDWGNASVSNGTSPLYGIPFNVVHGNAPGAAKIDVIIDKYPEETDFAAVPIPDNAAVEGDYQNGPNLNGGGYGDNQRGDSHLLLWDEDNNVAYEFFGVTRPQDPSLFPDVNEVEQPHTDGLWHAAQETVWNMNTNTFRSLGNTSADASGMSILAGLARPDEGVPASEGGQGVINHALRFTLPAGDVAPQYVYPASHVVDISAGAANLPFGARLRLMNTPAVNAVIATLGPQAQVIAHTMQQYGLILADIGSSMYVSGASASVDTNNVINFTWNMDDVLGLSSLTAGYFQVVDLKPQVSGLSFTGGPAETKITITGKNFSGSAGHLAVLFGTAESSSVTVVDDSHLTATVPAGAGTVNVRVQSGANQIDPNGVSHNVAGAIFGYGISAIGSSSQFTYGPQATTRTVSALGSSVRLAAASIASGGANVVTLNIIDTAGVAMTGLTSAAFDFTLSAGTSTGTFGSVIETATRGTYHVTFTGRMAGSAARLTASVFGLAITSAPAVVVTPGAVSATMSEVSVPASTISGRDIDTVTIVLRDAAGNTIGGMPSSAFLFAFSDSVRRDFQGRVTETVKGTYVATFVGTRTARPCYLSVFVKGLRLSTQPLIKW